MELTPIGAEFESVIAGTLLFLLGGLVCFVFCFAFTKCYICYKRRLLRKKRRHSLEDYAVLEVDAESRDLVLDAARSGARAKSGRASLSSASTHSTNA